MFHSVSDKNSINMTAADIAPPTTELTNGIDLHLRKLEKKINETSFINAKTIGTDYTYKHEVVWKNAIGFLILHLLGIWGVIIGFSGQISWRTILWTVFYGYFTSEGVTIGAHRLFAHKTFKAHPILKALLLLAQTGSGQNSMFIWCRDHRLHHRYSDTDADPHNSKRGFFFCHMGWLMAKKHPYVLDLGRKIDMSDLENEPMVMFQKKFYYPLYIICAIIIPVIIPYLYFGEQLHKALLFCYFARYILTLNGTWLVNSAAHLYGTRPYDQKLQPVESWFVSFISLGEGWHNYHHAFPWDYKAAELHMHFNQSATLIEWFEKIGLAYDLKTASNDMVQNRIKSSGDGTHYKLGNEEAKASVKTSFPPHHPLNPSYTTKFVAPAAILKQEGLPLFHEKDVFNYETNAKTKFVGST